MLMSTPVKVSTFGWMRSATQMAMIARSGKLQTVPTRPVNVMGGWRIQRRRGPACARFAYN